MGTCFASVGVKMKDNDTVECESRLAINMSTDLGSTEIIISMKLLQAVVTKELDSNCEKALMWMWMWMWMWRGAQVVIY